MRTKNEKILLAFLLVILFVGGNYYGYRWLSQKQAALELTYAQLRADKADAEADLVDKSTWAQRKAWIEAHEPVLGDEGDAKAKVQQEVAKGARDNKLEIVDQNLNDVQHGPSGTQVSVKVHVKGPMESLCHWLADLQKPESFYAISTISLNLETDQKSFNCTLQVARYFKGGS